MKQSYTSTQIESAREAVKVRFQAGGLRHHHVDTTVSLTQRFAEQLVQAAADQPEGFDPLEVMIAYGDRLEKTAVRRHVPAADLEKMRAERGMVMEALASGLGIPQVEVLPRLNQVQAAPIPATPGTGLRLNPLDKPEGWRK